MYIRMYVFMWSGTLLAVQPQHPLYAYAHTILFNYYVISDDAETWSLL